jgi:tetratricopeptide (TPR) repeat protein
MKVGCGARSRILVVTGCLLLALQVSLAQKKTAVGTNEGERGTLIDKARALESRGRPDMAVQLWQQILLSQPNNPDALAGVAKDYKLMGEAGKADAALDRLRRVNPKDPNIAKIEALSSSSAQSDELRHAGELAKQGRADEAMQIYRQLYGDHPPEGPIAIAYYQTLFGTATGKAAAIAGMRSLADRNPGDSSVAVALGTLLTYDAKTRPEGIRILEAHPQDADAQAALRQALIWDSANPASAAGLRQYLKEHPQDTEVATNLKSSERKLAQMNAGIARTPAERAAFAALNAHRLDDAQRRFEELLQKDPKNGRVAAGMGFLRMQQKNFGDAISYLNEAEQDGYKARTVENALATSRFWFTMAEATQAFDQNQLAVAEAKYKAALGMNPRSPEALNGLAGLLTKEQKYPQAAGVYEQLIKVQPSNLDGWRGLFLAYASDHQNQKALSTAEHYPARVRLALERDPEYLRSLASIYQAQGRTADAQRVLAQALALPFPDNGTGLKTDTRLQYAGILMEARRYDQAAALYTQILNEDRNNLSAWLGLVSAHHVQGQDTQAIADVQKMPPATYEAALGDSGFLSLLGAIYQQANQLEVAQGLLERSERLQTAAGGQPSAALELQLAGIYLLRNNTEQAYDIYNRVLKANPGSADAWKGLISTLSATNRNAQALEEIALIPAPVRKQLESDIDFMQTEAGVYAASGDTAHAVEYMNRVQAHYARLKMQPPPNVDIQNAWLLYNTGNDRALYPALMRLGSRNDLSATQRETVQNIWANWSVRRAAAAMENGNVRRAVDILDAASQAFPDNLTVRKAVAGGFARVGRAKESLSIYKSIPMQEASSGDFQGAIGAALQANDRGQAELWLRQALERYPHDPAVLSLGARYEQARGDNERAADYWRAALAAMPAATPVDRLAHQLAYPEQDTKSHRAVTAADLQNLLDPDHEPFAKTTKVPPLPAYGPDPYNGPTPVMIPQPQSYAPQPADAAGRDASSPSGGQSGSAPDENPQIKAIPSSQTASPQLFQQQSATRLETGESGLSQAGFGGLVVRDAIYHPQDRVLRFGATTTPQPGYGVGASGAASAEFEQAQYSSRANVPIAANAPHSMASDAWKGLVFSLMAGNRDSEALETLNKIPPDVRRQLEADIEFVQGVASLYVAVGDAPMAREYLTRVENYYMLHRSAAPAGLEVQHAWLLYNLKDDVALYPLMLRLDARPDLNAAERAQLDSLWATWAVRRAETAMEEGNLLRGVEILQAASKDYPDNLDVRRAVAGAYARVGRAADAVTLFKTIPMESATPSDYQGAISAALGATDMAQAEAWLRQALARFPSDPKVLGLAARFEQARGNNERAADYWRAALATMPADATIKSLDSGFGYPAGSFAPSAPGDTKRLLDPRHDPAANSLPPLPAYPPSASNQAPVNLASPPAESAPQHQWLNAPSNDPLPMPGGAGVSIVPLPNTQGTAPGNAPVYIPQNAQQGTSIAQPVLIQQSWTHSMTMWPAVSATHKRKKSHKAHAAHTATRAPVRARSAASPAPTPRRNAGTVHLPPSEQTLASTEPAASAVPPPGLRIASEPMGPLAAQVHARFAEETDSQLTQGSAAAIHTLSNTPVNPQMQMGAAGTAQVPATATEGQYTPAQYTPSAQEAATGAYSVPRKQAEAPAAKPAASTTATYAHARTHKKTKRATQQARRQAGQPTTSTLGNAAALKNAPETPAAESSQQNQSPYDAQAQSPAPASTGAGLTDEELEQRNLPPLRGPWVRVQREPKPVSPREEAEMQLRAIESGYSGWLGGAGYINYRSGALGFDHLAALESPFEASAPLGYNGRVTIVAKPVFLDSGQADGSATISVLQSTTGGNKLTAIPEPIGTLTTTDVNPPAQQNAVGFGGEVQLAFPHAAIAGGYTPYGFLVSTFTARGMFRPGNGPVTVTVARDSVKDSQLSYAGLRDPAGNTLGNQGQIWGGVVANQGNVQFSRGDASSGFYFGAGGQYLTGYHVESNTRIDGTGGAYWRVMTSPEYGNLSIGVNFFAMHYANNQNAFTHGMGGYFSPQGYFLANVPFTFVGHYGTNWHYNVVAGLGVQAFQEDKTPLWPLAADKAIETGQNNPFLPDVTNVGPNYDLRGQVAYQISPHWFAGGFFGANNTRNYSSASAGFSIRYMFRAQPSTATGPTGIFPTDGLRPFTVP